ncbi:hypothetical protein DV738_g2368, partial [Chaetothyriales sp. CBS 135597]
MSRYAPPPRDRSPPRYDRRPSSTFSAGGSSYRGTVDSALPPVDRAPPRGPKADGFRGGFQSTTFARGRGGSIFPGRSADSWDRERDRDSRAPPSSYRSRDDDRADGWRRDRDLALSDRPLGLNRDSRPYGGRDRSASPPRTRRDSRESIPSLSGRPSDSGAAHYGPSSRGTLGRGTRGRADWDRRGRSSFASDRERDLFPNRSRSRDGWREREYDRGRTGTEPDRFDRRDRSRERDARGSRDHDFRPRDQSPVRGVASQPPARGTSPAVASGPPKPDLDPGRRASFVTTPGFSRDSRRDVESSDYLGARTDSRRRDLPPSTPYQPSLAPSAPASGGLDYGPPPSISPTPASVDKPASGKPTPLKTDSSTAPSTAFQPPSGPKADRNNSVTSAVQPIKSSHQPDPLPKPEPSRPRVPEAESPVLSVESSSKTTDIRNEPRVQQASPPPKTMPASVPLGPRSSVVSTTKQRLPSTEPPAQLVTPKPGPDSRALSIPTGPRLDRETPARPPAGVSNRSWISPDYNRAKPSIMSSLNRERPPFSAPTGPRSQTSVPPREEKSRIFPSPTTPVANSTPPITKNLLPSDTPSQPPGSGTVPSKDSDVEMSLPVSSDEEGDEDEFDEDDFQASEEKYLLERSLIEARRPPPLLQDHIIRSLLVRIQFLNMLFYDAAPVLKEEDTIMEDVAKPTPVSQTGLPSPDRTSEEQEKSEIQHPQPRGRPLSQAPINPIPTPPLDELPYLRREVLSHTVFEDSDDEVQQEATTTLIRQEFESSAFEWQNGLDDLKAGFKRMYIPWKQEILSLEQKDRELHHGSPVPVSPAPSAAASISAAAGHERTRGARNTTEADLQAAILMSQQSAKEEEERREREATANSGPNLDTEAVIPTMLKPDEVRLELFEDTNGLIPIGIALDVFSYIPPEDDFTEEEQLAFIQAYCQTPKKWGKIAEAVQSRSYQECITHYYLTKNEAKYKEIWRRSQPKRKRGRAAASKPRSTALMSELMYGEEAEGNVAVTDTGRPRRAAAPTFGDNGGESDMGAPAPQAKRVAGNNKDSSGEASTTKAGRGRKAGTGTKTRRTKAQIQADQQAAALLLPAVAPDGSHQKTVGVTRTERARTILRSEDGGENLRYGHAVPSAGISQTTSYWSVPEQKMFPTLVGHFGKDFAAIAEHMKTKTPTMIRNYYNRHVSDGNSELDEIAREAERRRAAGEHLCPPPSPATQTKRRYEASPSTASVTRPAATPSESAFNDIERQPLQSKPGYTDDFPSNAVQRTASGELIAKPRSSRDAFRESQPLAAHAPKHEEGPKTGIFSQKPFGGPRPGIFKEEGSILGMPAQNIHSVPHEPPPHQHPMRSNEYRGVDIVGPALAGSPQQVPLVHMRDPVMTSTPPAGNVLGQIQPQADKYGVLVYPKQQQGRSVNLGPGHAPLEQEGPSGRRFDPPPREMPLSFGRTQSPALTHVQPIGVLRKEEQFPSPAPPSEPPKPAAPAKRSNIMSILNNDPDPPKRPAADPPSVPASQPAAISTPTAQYERRPDFRQEERPSSYGHDLRPQFAQPAGLQATSQLHREHPATFAASPASGPNDAWIARYDPRTQPSASESRTLHQSPRPGPYSVVPPDTQSETTQPVQSLRMEQQRSLDPADHRRTILGQIGHPGSNPSPPPQQNTSYRPMPSSSHHVRMQSLGYQTNPPQQMSHTHKAQQAGNHPHSASPTPVHTINRSAKSSATTSCPSNDSVKPKQRISRTCV